MDMVTEHDGEDVPLLQLLPMLFRLLNLAEVKKQYGLTKSQILILIVLYYRKMLNMSQVAQYVSSSKEQATRTVAGLVEHGLVERFDLPENRTHVYIRFSAAGQAYAESFRQALYAELNARLASALSAEEQQRLQQSVQYTVEMLRRVE